MNNEPVAWMDSVGELIPTELLPWFEENGYTHIPLYNHPAEHDLGIAEAIGFDKGYAAAQAKTLTDEEIWDFINALCLDMGDYWELTEKNAIPMIREILRKAQEN